MRTVGFTNMDQPWFNSASGNYKNSAIYKSKSCDANRHGLYGGEYGSYEIEMHAESLTGLT